MHMAYRGRRHEIIKQLRLQQKPDNRNAFLRNLKIIQLRNVWKEGNWFPPNHTWLIENSDKFYAMWRNHFDEGRLHDRRISTIHNTDSQQWIYVVNSNET